MAGQVDGGEDTEGGKGEDGQEVGRRDVVVSGQVFGFGEPIVELLEMVHRPFLEGLVHHVRHAVLGSRGAFARRQRLRQQVRVEE